VKGLLRLYPKSWRKRYGGEMDALVEDLPAEAGVVLDLVVGAAVAYATVVRANRVLTSGAAYLHGVCVAVLLQAIAFVALVLVSQQTQSSTIVDVGPFRFATVVREDFFLLHRFALTVGTLIDSAPAGVLLMLLVATLGLVIAVPRRLRRKRALKLLDLAVLT
jgi:hypothetical protein